MKNSFLLAVIAGLPFSVSAFAHKGATGIVKERMDNFKASQMALRQVLAASKPVSYTHLTLPTKWIV